MVEKLTLLPTFRDSVACRGACTSSKLLRVTTHSRHCRLYNKTCSNLSLTVQRNCSLVAGFRRSAFAYDEWLLQGVGKLLKVFSTS